MSTESTPRTQSDLQRTFVAMLFAFVAATIAQQIGEILVVGTKSWTLANSPTRMMSTARVEGWLLATAATHAALALLMVTVSWISWSQSQAGAHVKDIKTVFSLKFLIFLVEIFLVVLYFSLSKSAEGDFGAYVKSPATESFIKLASARPEALQLMWIFLSFAVWDYLVDVLSHERREASKIKAIEIHLRATAAFCGVSIACLLLALLVSRVTPWPSASPAQVVFGDIALMLAILIFIAAKPFEYYLTRNLSEAVISTVTPRKAPPSRTEKRRLTTLLLLFAASTILTKAWPCFQQ